LPAQVGEGKIITVGQGAALEIGGEEVVGAGASGEKRLVYVAGDAGGAFVEIVGGEVLT
jgi:hypothetical protein